MHGRKMYRFRSALLLAVVFVFCGLCKVFGVFVFSGQCSSNNGPAKERQPTISAR